MDPVFFDTETRSRTPISYGTDRYTRDAECIIATWARGDRPTQCWDALDDVRIPNELDDILRDDRVPLIAHSAKFDRNIVRHALGISTSIYRWRCTMSQAYAHGLPGSLDLLGLVLKVAAEEQKMAEGHDLIQVFCVPKDDGTFWLPHEKPELWETFKRYAVRDTDSLRADYRKLAQHNYSGENLRFYHVDQLINERGFGFDAKFAAAAVQFLAKAKERHDMEIAQATNGRVTAATQRNRLLDYLQKQLGLDIPNMRAAELRTMLESDELSPEARFLIETRLEAGKSSGSKYRTGLRNVGPGARMRQTLQFNGAGRTGRESGRGFQPQNMTRPVVMVQKEDGTVELQPVKAKYIDEVVMPAVYSGAALDGRLAYGGPNEAGALCMRHTIKAALGNELVAADYSNIEGRIVAWIAGEEWKLAAYRAQDAGTGKDTYKLLFAEFFGVPVDAVNDTERQSGKVVDLACGFGGGVGALVTMAASYQMPLEPLVDIVLPRATEDQLRKAEKAWRRAFLTGEDYLLEYKVFLACHVLVQLYRTANSKINQLKHDVDNAVKFAVKNPGSAAIKVGKCLIWSTPSWLIIQLPSGRRLLYAAPKVHHAIETDPDSGKPIHREWISYCTARGKQWRRERSWSGLFIENIVQAIANDCLRVGILRVHDDTLTVPAIAAYLAKLPPEERTAVCLHVHDEIVLDVPVGSYPKARLIELMIKRTDWNEGLPLAAAGWVNPRYGKR